MVKNFSSRARDKQGGQWSAGAAQKAVEKDVLASANSLDSETDLQR